MESSRCLLNRKSPPFAKKKRKGWGTLKFIWSVPLLKNKEHRVCITAGVSANSNTYDNVRYCLYWGGADGIGLRD